MSGRTPAPPKLKPGTKTTPMKVLPLSSLPTSTGSTRPSAKGLLRQKVQERPSLEEEALAVISKQPRSRGPAGAGAGAGAPPPPPKRGDEDDAGSKFLVYQIFGEEVGNAMALAAGYGKKYDFRGVFEPVDASDQCTAIIEAFPEEGAPCYLCGLPIPPKAELGNNPAHELYPECEHILPVTEARIYLALYMGTGRDLAPRETDDVRASYDAWKRRALALEYRWAHRVCNQAKTNDSFVKSDGEGGLAPSDKGFLTILSNIRKRATKNATSGAYEEYSATFTAIARDILARKKVILKDFVIPIIAHVNTLEVKKFPGVATLARVAALVDPQNMLAKVAEAMKEENTTESRDARLNRFVDEFLTEYPRFASPAMQTSLLQNLDVSYPGVFTEQDLEFVPSSVRSSLGRYFTTIIKTPGLQPLSDHDAASVLSNVIYYGIYRALMEKVSTSNEARFTDNVRVGVYDQTMAFFEELEGDTLAADRIRTLELVFGPPPPAPRSVDAAQARIDREMRRARRADPATADAATTAAEALEADAAAEIEQYMTISLQDALDYYFADLRDRLQTSGIPDPVIPTIVDTIVSAYQSAFDPADPRGTFEHAIRVTYPMFVEHFNEADARAITDILLTLGNEDFISEDERERMVAEAALTEEGITFVPKESRLGAGAGASNAASVRAPGVSSHLSTHLPQPGFGPRGYGRYYPDGTFEPISGGGKRTNRRPLFE